MLHLKYRLKEPFWGQIATGSQDKNLIDGDISENWGGANCKTSLEIDLNSKQNIVGGEKSKCFSKVSLKASLRFLLTVTIGFTSNCTGLSGAAAGEGFTGTIVRNLLPNDWRLLSCWFCEIVTNEIILLLCSGLGNLELIPIPGKNSDRSKIDPWQSSRPQLTKAMAICICDYLREKVTMTLIQRQEFPQWIVHLKHMLKPFWRGRLFCFLEIEISEKVKLLRIEV